MKTLAAAFVLTIISIAGGNKRAEALDLANVKDLIGIHLKDPWSAQYRNVKQSGAYICGEVNAKTSAGGYAGYVPFLIIGGRDVYIIDGSMQASDSASAKRIIKITELALACFKS